MVPIKSERRLPEGWWKNIAFISIKIIVCMSLLVVLISVAFFWAPAKVHYHVIEKYTFSGVTKEESINLGVIIPASGPYQQVENIDISWDGQLEMEDGLNVTLIKLTNQIKPNSILEATIEYEVILPQGYVSWDSPVTDFHTSPQRGIESDDIDISERAAMLSEGQSQSAANNIYNFTSEYLTYSKDTLDCVNSSAKSAYQLGACVCTGYARLMVALCRASQIPSQMVMGYIYPDPVFMSPEGSNDPNNAIEGHAWVEFFSEGSWKIADPTLGNKFFNFLYINRNDGRHISYGEIEQFLKEYTKLYNWGIGRAKNVLYDNQCMRFTATATTDQIVIDQSMVVEKGWDGRWLNTLGTWLIFMLILCRYRKKIVSKFN